VDVRRNRGRTTIGVPGVRVADDLRERRFGPTAPTAGSPTWSTCGHGGAGSTSPWSRTPTAARSSAGQWPTTCVTA